MKYVLTNETCHINGHIVHRIMATQAFYRQKGVPKETSESLDEEELEEELRYYVQAGELGGWVETEENLSQEDGCWIEEGAAVYGNARVCDFGQVCDSAQVYDSAQVCGKVTGDARVFGEAYVGGSGRIFDKAQVYGMACIRGGRVEGNAQVYGNAYMELFDAVVAEDAKVYGNARIEGKNPWERPCICVQGKVFGDARIGGRAIVLGKVCGHAIIRGEALVDNNEVIAGDTVVETRTLGTKLRVMWCIFMVKIACWLFRCQPYELARCWDNM